MKKILIAAFAIALPVIASAQVNLISGYNFGQFLGNGAPTLDGTDPFTNSGSIGANYGGLTMPPSSSSGDFVGANGLPGNYSNGTGRLYWDGTNGSTAYDFVSGVEITSVGSSPNSVNGYTASGFTMAFQGDDINQSLQSAVTNGKLAFVTNTLGFADYDHTLFSQSPLLVSDQNLTFAASVAAPVSINWYLNGSGTSFATTNLSGSTFASYSVDLPAGFYGLAAATLVAEFSGTAIIDNVQFNGALAAIPEPSTYAAILGVCTLGFVMYRRRQNANVLA